MVATYPASIVTHGQALNITCQSYAGHMNFGFTGCHSSLPSMQRLAVYTADALADMEKTFLPGAAQEGGIVLWHVARRYVQRPGLDGIGGRRY